MAALMIKLEQKLDAVLNKLNALTPEFVRSSDYNLEPSIYRPYGDKPNGLPNRRQPVGNAHPDARVLNS